MSLRMLALVWMLLLVLWLAFGWWIGALDWSAGWTYPDYR
jgi:hypothetical protein